MNFFETESGLANSLDFGYSFFSISDRRERPIKLIRYDQRTKTVTIPVIVEDDEFPMGRVTDKLIVYRFDGVNFVKGR